MEEKSVVSIAKNANQLVEVDIHAVSDWEGFEKLIQFMKNNYSVSVIEKIDGPDARRWRLKSGDLDFELIHDDPYGNSLIAIDSASNQIVETIGLDLQQRLSQA